MTQLTDERRVEAVREIWDLACRTDRQMLPAIYEYERLARERLRGGDTLPAPPPDAE